MSSRESQADLHSMFVALTERWKETRNLWHDHVAADFEREIWSEIDQAVRRLERSAESLHAVLDQALRRTER